ncbi:Cap-specific mRNA (nucleoside-2'-O-)-methyltransferase 1 [Acropora cervicornis]|uniref:Cap-specific mRNA (nucleoside-2'-O-)-methyltransferase 1 n=1 Tax=Acropora cervicornis TaxID=6130 RepID=A0AAD9UYD0_ACRCE|nr:Cap-specific mRNA (nucleoside-2'-O-)-methyltransferase 1 [Acropora cervicornis]
MMSGARKRQYDDFTYGGTEKKIKAESRLSSSDSEDELGSPSYASFLQYTDNKPFYSDVAKKQMERMGYKGEERLGKSESTYSNFAQRQMESMGFEQGRGLGRHGQGRADIIEASQQRGRRGLGFKVEGFDDKDFTWEEEDEVEFVEHKACIPSCTRSTPTKQEMEDWVKIDKKKLFIDDETQFCEDDVLAEVLKSKSVFDALSGDEFLKARTRANPYELIRGAIFQNRAAMKMANMDSAFDFMFTSPKDATGKDVVGSNELLYFADLCAGPGGFSEYVLWRKGWQAKGFGFTLVGDNDFKLEQFLAGTPETFEPHYGANNDGDIFNADNLTEFRRFVLDSSDNKGVHFVMADGGFSVEGQENIQEILSKQLYLCQFLCALSILRPGGHFVCKVFDLFTPFSIGLVYLMYRVFDEVYIFKPVTSRPANSERYVVCKGLRENSQAVHEFMFNVNVRINKLKKEDILDVVEVVPLHILQEDEEFSSYMLESNNRIGKVQANSLKKLRAYVQDTTLFGRYDQGEVKKTCLEKWKIPEQARAAQRAQDPDVKFDELWKGFDDEHCFDSEATKLTSRNIQNLKCLYNYKCFVSGGERWFLMGLGRSNIYKWDGKPNYLSSTRWRKLENFYLELPRDTLIEVEIIQELRGEGKGQRKAIAVHIVDAVILGGKDVRNLHYHERYCSGDIVVNRCMTIRLCIYDWGKERCSTRVHRASVNPKKVGERVFIDRYRARNNFRIVSGHHDRPNSFLLGHVSFLAGQMYMMNYSFRGP